MDQTPSIHSLAARLVLVRLFLVVEQRHHLILDDRRVEIEIDLEANARDLIDMPPS